MFLGDEGNVDYFGGAFRGFRGADLDFCKVRNQENRFRCCNRVKNNRCFALFVDNGFCRRLAKSNFINQRKVVSFPDIVGSGNGRLVALLFQSALLRRCKQGCSD